MRCSAFTLVELLIVIAIIATLTALTVAAATLVRDSVRSSTTQSRLEDVARALAQTRAASSGSTPALALHSRLAALTGSTPPKLPGVVDFLFDNRTNETRPAAGQGWIPVPYPAYCFRHPWGQTPTDVASDGVTSLPAAGADIPIETHALGDLTPVYSAELLVAAGIAETTASYRTDRSPKQPWNDAWGNPLIIGLGLYQPRQNTLIARTEAVDWDGRQVNDAWRSFVRQDLFLNRAKAAYGYTRAIYLAPAAIGPVPHDPLTTARLAADDAADWTADTTGVLATAWSQIETVCNRDGTGTAIWRTDGAMTPPVNAMTKPPWNGVIKRKANGQSCFLAAPLEIR